MRFIAFSKLNAACPVRVPLEKLQRMLAGPARFEGCAKTLAAVEFRKVP